MIDRLRGIILEKRLDGVVVESGSFGLRVFLPGPNLGRLDEGDEVVLYTYLQVKDDGFSLFGFLDEEDRELFLLLIGVSGVGPKVAMGIFSRFSAGDVIYFIQNGDAKSLTEAPGIGKKTAQRLILELKDKMKDLHPVAPTADVVQTSRAEPQQDALDALISLGYSPNEARDAVKGIDSDDVEIVLKEALKRLAMKG
ncbi:Holliday junction branch migration protein RuvA [Aedoeadaptatus pacaensis]|uniref:Holliday junction branch migration protein RuvA n=1 Tax=Aedoeadaptatus pacaensis TaxID=1776390 RepID=UPI00083910AF|nr:Holliday junction branch migration protein RuvA [Peptoniphilus pacaensis]